MRTHLLAAALAVLPALVAPAQPLTTAFTYEGRLDANGSPASGTYDFRFTLFDAATSGTQQGPALCVNNLAVSGGGFTAQLDFGSQFSGQQRFLEISVRQDTGLDCSNSTGFIVLSPRQNLTASPNAVYSLNASNAVNATLLNGQPSSFYLNASNLTAGTLPDARLSTSVDLVNAAQTIGGAKTFSAAPAFTAAGAPFSVTSTALVTNLNADLLDGLSAAGFVQTSGTQTANGAKTFAGPTYLNGFVGIGGATSPIGAANFVVNQNTGLFGGMYINATGAGSSPFYGYAESGTIVGFHYVDSLDSNKWKLNVNAGVRMTVTGAGDVGIGTASPSNHLTVSQEADVNCFLAINSGSTAAQTSGLRLNDRNNAVWSINKNTSNDLTIRAVGPCADRRSISPGGGVGIGSSAPPSGPGLFVYSGSVDVPIAVKGQSALTSGLSAGGLFTADSPDGTGVNGVASNTSGMSHGVIGDTYGPAGRGVLGRAFASGGASYGVMGSTSSSSTSAYGVFSFGQFGATGTKSFRIDHPADPQNKYLVHYCTESPEVLNAYSGTIRLDESGEAVVQLPPYFAYINKDPRYQLTALGAPMPALHVAEEIDENALTQGAAAAPGDSAPPCAFRIAGGQPSGRVSWRVEAVRNDRWIRAHGAPVEVEKEGFEKGTYQHPGLYGQPEEKGQCYLPRPIAPAAQPSSPR